MNTDFMLKVVSIVQREDTTEDHLPYKYVRAQSIRVLPNGREVLGATSGFTFRKEINGKETKESGLWHIQPGDYIEGHYETADVEPYEIEGNSVKTFSAIVLQGQTFRGILNKRKLVLKGATIPTAPKAPESVSDEETEETITVPKVSKAALTREQE
ncbi:hypothetical protein KKH23_07210 [Patescibacteria group bacterium]|uniref:Uncharacterized protein n=1 Tax=viral metagenome TaxID=1070528 RepID=A0A6M3X4Q7_9ZZZZ|nr:hypothetical protein [Patescibacteria group bacterium]